jgi:hypothetical protein
VNYSIHSFPPNFVFVVVVVVALYIAIFNE